MTTTPPFLSDRQIAAFDTDGYLRIPRAIDPGLIAGTAAAADAAIERGLAEYQATSLPPETFAVVETGGAPYVRRINDLHRRLAPWSLALLGSPAVVRLARELCGNDPVPIYDSLVVKSLGDSDAIGLHQDMIHPRTGRIATVGIYLDPAGRGESGLRVLPGTQHVRQDICEIERRLTVESPTEIEVGPGDVLLHDVMLVHGSGPLGSRPRRRTVYFELRSAGEAARNPGFTNEWIDLRRELFALARGVHARFEAGRAFVTEEETAWIEEMYLMQWRIEVGHYCGQG